MRSRSLAFALGLGILAVGMTVACGRSGPSDSPDDVGDPWAVRASSETRSALGVQTWGFRTIGAGALSVRGYDESKEAVVEVRQQATMADAAHWVLDLGVAHSGAKSMIQYSLAARAAANGTEVSGNVDGNTLGSDDEAQKILDRLRSDLQASSGSGRSTLDTTAIRFLTDLSSGSGDITTGGSGNITNGGGDITKGDPSLTGDGGADGGSGGNNGNNGNGGNKGNSGNGNNCQQSDKQGSNQCGGDMMSSLGPLLGALGSGASGLSSFTGIFGCMQDGGTQADQGANLAELAKCAFQEMGAQDAGSGGGAGGPASALSSLLGTFSQMQSMGQNCNCPQQ
jgi:hypothetical protein